MFIRKSRETKGKPHASTCLVRHDIYAMVRDGPVLPLGPIDGGRYRLVKTIVLAIGSFTTYAWAPDTLGAPPEKAL